MRLFVAGLLLSFICSHAAMAGNLTKSDLAKLVSLALEEMDSKRDPKYADKYKPVVMIDESMKGLADASAFGVPVGIRTREQVRAEQLAIFTTFSIKEESANKVVISYNRPMSGHFGDLTFARSGGSWQLDGHDKKHSSAGGRMYYGQLYDGTTCRDGTEMAGRWNTYNEITKDIAAGKAPDMTKSVPKICPGSEFPEVTQYRKSKEAEAAKASSPN